MYCIIYFLDYGNSFGGAANTLLQQALLMKAAGNEVIVFTSNYLGMKTNKKYNRLLTQHGIELEQATYQISSQLEDIDIFCMEENYEEVRDRIKKLKPDLLHSVQLNPMVELISRELEIPHIMNIYPLKKDFFEIVYIDIFPYYHICDSWYWAKQWHQYLGTDSICIRTVVNQRISRKSINRQKRKNRYICVGSIYKEKNQLSVIKAFHKALAMGIKGELFLYGYTEGSYAEACRKYIEENNLEKSVLLKGFYEDMETEYQSSDVLICGSTRESFPNVISEAMANGVIVISTPVAGVPEVIEDHINGYLTEDYTQEAICKKILEFDEERRKGNYECILENAYNTFIRNHSPEVITPQLMKYYQYVVTDKKKRSDTDIEEIRKCFANWKACFTSSYNHFTKPSEVSLKIWYLYHVQDRLEAARKKNFQFYIWGTGNCGVVVKEMVEIFFPKITLYGFVDSYKTESFLSYPIYKPDDVLERPNIIILVAVFNGQEEIVEKLEEHAKVIHEDYFILSPRRW